MPRDNFYPIDTHLEATDSWLGTDSQNRRRTINITPATLEDYLGRQGFGTALAYQFRRTDNTSFPTDGGFVIRDSDSASVTMSGVSELIFSTTDNTGAVIEPLLRQSIGSQIVLRGSQSGNSNNFGIFTIDTVDPLTVGTTVQNRALQVAVTFISGSNRAVLTADEYYVGIQIGSGGGSAGGTTVRTGVTIDGDGSNARPLDVAPSVRFPGFGPGSGTALRGSVGNPNPIDGQYVSGVSVAADGTPSLIRTQLPAANEAPAIIDRSGSPVLADDITQAEVRTAIGAGTSNLEIGNTATTALAGNTRVITDQNLRDIAQNNAKDTFPGYGNADGDALRGNVTEITAAANTFLNSVSVNSNGLLQFGTAQAGTGGTIATGGQFPSNPATGMLFILTGTFGQFLAGLYRYTGTEWLTVDHTFEVIRVATDDMTNVDLVADGHTDRLTINRSTGVTLAAASGTDTMTIGLEGTNINNASVSGDTLTLTRVDGTTVDFTASGGTPPEPTFNGRISGGFSSRIFMDLPDDDDTTTTQFRFTHNTGFDITTPTVWSLTGSNGDITIAQDGTMSIPRSVGPSGPTTNGERSFNVRAVTQYQRTGTTDVMTDTQNHPVVLFEPFYIFSSSTEPALNAGMANSEASRQTQRLTQNMAVDLPFSGSNNYVQLSLPDATVNPAMVSFFANGFRVVPDRFTDGISTGYTGYRFQNDVPQTINIRF